MSPPPDPRLSAVLLAGGRGSRMGGVEKALLRREGRTQIQHWLHELRRRDIRTVVVGPRSLRHQIPSTVPLVQESPPFAGPAAAVLAGAAELARRGGSAGAEQGPETCDDAHPVAGATAWTLLLAVDLTEPAALLDWLLGELERSEATPGCEAAGASVAVLPCDVTGRQQYLSAAVPTGWLMHRTAQLTPAQAEHRPLRWLLHGLDEAAVLQRPVLPRGLGEDVDTLDDAHRLGVSLP